MQNSGWGANLTDVVELEYFGFAPNQAMGEYSITLSVLGLVNGVP